MLLIIDERGRSVRRNKCVVIHREGYPYSTSSSYINSCAYA